MRNAVLALSLLAGGQAILPVLAQQLPVRTGRIACPPGTIACPPFPDDYTPSSCAPAQSCISYSENEIPNAAFAMMGLQVDLKWMSAHYPALQKLYEPICRKHATCLGTAGNNFLFCDDMMATEFRKVCDDNFPKSKNLNDWDQCKAITETWLLGVDQHAKEISDHAQECVKESGLDKMRAKAPVVWTVPAQIARDYTGYITIYALDPDTHVPVAAEIAIEGQIVYAPANPAGSVATGYPFKWTPKFNRVKNSEGHEDLVAPMLTIKSPLYPEVKLPMPATPPKMIVEIKPSLAKLHNGNNLVTVFAKDAQTGKPVEARVMVGEYVGGEANQPFELEVKKGKRPEIWVTSLFDAYSDVVVR
jgi:hypothetical protein